MITIHRVFLTFKSSLELSYVNCSFGQIIDSATTADKSALLR